MIKVDLKLCTALGPLHALLYTVLHAYTSVFLHSKTKAKLDLNYGCIQTVGYVKRNLCLSKGQLILKVHFSFQFSQKTNEKFLCPMTLGQKLTFSSTVFCRIEDTEISFWDYPTFNLLIKPMSKLNLWTVPYWKSLP